MGDSGSLTAGGDGYEVWILSVVQWEDITGLEARK